MMQSGKSKKKYSCRKRINTRFFCTFHSTPHSIPQACIQIFILMKTNSLLLINTSHLLFLLKGIARDVVQTDSRLVGVLDKHKLGLVLVLRHDHVDESANNGPAVVEVQVHLGGEFARLVAEDAEDDVVVCCLGVDTRYETVIFVLANCLVVAVKS